jgi:hypothetical protein
VTCVSEVVTLPSGGRMADECPSAIVAFGAVAAPLGSIARIHIDPRPFACGNLWPGIASTPVCFGALILSGSAMHGWATFVGTDKVAAIELSRSWVGTSFGPWRGNLLAFVVPPAGWVMP